MQVRANGAAVGYAGLASCGSPWACPVCNAKIQGVRRLEVETAITIVQGQGGAGAFGAYTVQHHALSPLDPLWRALSTCWEGVARDGTVRRLRERLGLLGTIRAAEVTDGANGWHPHLHPVHLFAGPVTDGQVAALHAVQERAWIAAAERLGLRAPASSAQHLHRLSGDAGQAMGEYFAKSTYGPTAAAWEVTSTQTKSSTRASGSRTPWELLHAVRVDGDADALDRWGLWEAGSKGKRALTWSKGLRARLGLDDQEASDEDIAAAEVGSADDTGFTITDWGPVRANPRLGGELLTAIDAGRNWAAGRAFCRAHGIPLSVPAAMEVTHA